MCPQRVDWVFRVIPEHPELADGVVGDHADEVLLRGEIVMQRRMVNADVFSNLAETKPFEATLGDSVERRTDQLRTPLRALSTNHLVDSSEMRHRYSRTLCKRPRPPSPQA